MSQLDATPLYRVFILGAFPPPVHGLAAVNLFVLQELRRQGCEVVDFNLAHPDFERSWRGHIYKIRKSIVGLWKYFWFAQRNTQHHLYIGLSGGFGQFFELPFVALARLVGANIILHHHSFAYIDKRSWLTAALIRSGGRLISHNVLSNRMGDLLQKLYGEMPYSVISNARTVEAHPKRTVRTSVACIGFLSNICFDKGIEEFVELARRMPKLQFVIAGPLVDQATRVFVERSLRELFNVSYRGPVSGSTKWDFFDQIDVLAFPTRYRNEAEPLVILEAFACGVPVVAYGRGSIPEIIRGAAGYVVPIHADFPIVAAERIGLWSASKPAITEASQSALRQFVSLRSGSPYIPKA